MDFGRSPGCQSAIVTSAGMALSLGLAWQGLFGEIDRKTINPVENSIGHFVLESVPGVNSRLRFGAARYSSDLADSEWKSRDSEI